MKKVIVVGATGSGKSTLAKLLARKLNSSYIQLDALFWKTNWQTSSGSEFFEKVQNAIDCPCWVLDGNYSKTHHLTWAKADTVIWIDFPFWLTFYQSLIRSFKRSFSRKEIWEGTGNKESLIRLLSKDSIILWLLKTYAHTVRYYEDRLADPKYSHIVFYRLKSRKEVKEFLATRSLLCEI